MTVEHFSVDLLSIHADRMRAGEGEHIRRLGSCVRADGMVCTADT